LIVSAYVKRLLVFLVAFAPLIAVVGRAAPVPESFRPRAGDLILMETSAGTIKLRLFADKAPLTVKNFLRYVEDKHYERTVFHRVIPNFVIQGGGLDANLAEKPARAPVRNESENGLSNRRGTVAVARTVDPDSGKCQFFINVKDNASLDRKGDNAGYCVFGEVVQGMDVVDQITKAPTGNQGGHANVPVQPIVILSVRRAN
jgi:peptidyl-prolyl cis-trans isomerase A (cyclophilin A)